MHCGNGGSVSQGKWTGYDLGCPNHSPNQQSGFVFYWAAMILSRGVEQCLRLLSPFKAPFLSPDLLPAMAPPRYPEDQVPLFTGHGAASLPGGSSSIGQCQLLGALGFAFACALVLTVQRASPQAFVALPPGTPAIASAARVRVAVPAASDRSGAHYRMAAKSSGVMASTREADESEIAQVLEGRAMGTWDGGTEAANGKDSPSPCPSSRGSDNTSCTYVSAPRHNDPQGKYGTVTMSVQMSLTLVASDGWEVRGRKALTAH